MAVHQLNTVSAQDALVDALRGRILGGELTPGAPISDVELAEEYGVARPTVRAAVQVLVHEGLMRREPRRRAFVPRLTADDIRDLYYVRTPLELTAIEALAKRRLVPPQAAEAVARLERLGRRGSWRDAVDADMEFHAALITAAGSPRLVRTYRSLATEMRLALVQLRPAYDSVSQLAAEHRGLLDAIASGSKRNACRLMQDHLRQAVEDLTTGAPT